MLRQSSSGAETVHTAGSVSAVDAAVLKVVQIGPNEYTLAAGGNVAGSFVSDGVGGYELHIGNLAGTGLPVRVGSETRIL